MSKQVIHMVWFEAPDVTDEQFSDTLKASKDLEAIPGVISSEFGLMLYTILTILELTPPIGRNFTQRAKTFNLALLVRLESKDALEAYQPHPIHLKFKEVIKPFTKGKRLRNFDFFTLTTI